MLTFYKCFLSLHRHKHLIFTLPRLIRMYYNAVNDLLKNTLITLMDAPAFEPFRLVGGTALSLQLGHRMSADIDLLSDTTYSSV